MELSLSQRRLTVVAAFLAWFFAGAQMALVPLTAQDAFKALHAGEQIPKSSLGVAFAHQTACFLFGAALGGIAFGGLGDLVGRKKSLAVTVLVYSLASLLAQFVKQDWQLLVVRGLIGLGVGGTWPCAVSLISEAWPNSSRPFLAGALGTSANCGVTCVGLLGQQFRVTPSNWTVAMNCGGAPLFLSVLIFFLVPESVRWLAQRNTPATKSQGQNPYARLFAPPLFTRMLLGICLGTIPLLGAWAAGKWMIPWAETVDTTGNLKASTQAIWGFGAVLGSAMGGWLADRCGRRLSYFLISAGSLLINFSMFCFLDPQHPLFLPMAFLLGFIATTYFGWLPLYLPELFPTAVRATGAGISYNVGRFASAAGVLGAGYLFQMLGGDYAHVGMVISMIYALGMVVILFAPSIEQLQD